MPRTKNQRKPRKLLQRSSLYPRIEVYEDGSLWMQVTPNGKWKKVPPIRARMLLDRLERAVRYSEQQRSK